MAYQDDMLNRLNQDEENNAICDAVLRVQKLLKEKVHRPPFPVEAFPLRLQAMMEGYYRVFGASHDHYGLSILTVAGMAMGNSVRLVEPNGAKHPPIFFSALVATPGSGKSPIIETCIAPVMKRHKETLAAYRLMVKELKEEAKRKNEEIELPRPEQPLVASFTMEALVDALQATPRGILIYRDELSAWINSMDQYKSKGDEKEFFLTAHTGGSYSVTRKNMDLPINLPNIMLGVLGGIQPGILETLTDSNSQSSGFLARILFSWPQTTEFRPYNNDEPDPDYAIRWERIINYLYDIRPDVITLPPIGDRPPVDKDTPRKIYLSGEAINAYACYYDDLQDRIKACESEVEMSTLVKFRTHCLRIALVLHGLEWACALTDANEFEYYGLLDKISEPISGDTMAKAVKVARYFEATGLRVVGSIDDPAESLPDVQREWYKALEDEGTRKTAVEVARSVNISSRTVDRLLKRKDLFRRERGGKWSKL